MNGERGWGGLRRLAYQTYGAVSMPINIALLVVSGLLVNGACPSPPRLSSRRFVYS